MALGTPAACSVRAAQVASAEPEAQLPQERAAGLLQSVPVEMVAPEVRVVHIVEPRVRRTAAVERRPERVSVQAPEGGTGWNFVLPRTGRSWRSAP